MIVVFLVVDIHHNLYAEEQQEVQSLLTWDDLEAREQIECVPKVDGLAC